MDLPLPVSCMYERKEQRSGLLHIQASVVDKKASKHNVHSQTSCTYFQLFPWKWLLHPKNGLF